MMGWFRRASAAAAGTAPGIRAYRDQGVVWVEAHGPFVLDSVEQFSDAVSKVYSQVPANQAIVNITVFSGSMQATPEVWAALDTHLRHINSTGLNLIATAWVAAPSLADRDPVIARAVHNFRIAGRLFKAFEQAEPAARWAQHLLAGH